MMLRHESWFTSFCADGGLMDFPNIELADIAKQLKASAVTWDDIAWIRQAWRGAIVIKGVYNVEDARRAVECGAEAIVISNDGGRQLDRVLPTLKILQDVVPALKGEKVEILMDGGIRSGTDVLAALAMGAKPCSSAARMPMASEPRVKRASPRRFRSFAARWSTICVSSDVNPSRSSTQPASWTIHFSNS